MLGHWAALLVYAAIAFVIPFSLLIGTFVVSTRSKRRAGDKQIPFESGVSSSTFTPGRFTISYYLTAMLFIVFDIEIVFLYPLALRMHQLKYLRVCRDGDVRCAAGGGLRVRVEAGCAGVAVRPVHISKAPCAPTTWSSTSC